MRFTDVHSHILWNVDDGIQAETDCMLCLKSAQTDEIGKIIVTPHVMPGKTDREDISEMNEKFKTLSEVARKYGIEIYRGCELLINRHTTEWLDDGIYFPIADSSYVLCEFDPRRDIDDLDDSEDTLYEMTLKGIIPIIAHAERAFHNKIDIDRVMEWVSMGCYIQVNRTSITGLHGGTCKNNAFKLIENGLCHIVGTDTHHASERRVMILSDAYNIINKKYGSDITGTIFFENPMRLLAGEELARTKAIKTRKFFRK